MQEKIIAIIIFWNRIFFLEKGVPGPPFWLKNDSIPFFFVIESRVIFWGENMEKVRKGGPWSLVGVPGPFFDVNQGPFFSLSPLLSCKTMMFVKNTLKR